jgi:hypothetical protein
VARGLAPDAGDVVWLNFTPHAGHEQAGHRPALVLSPAAYNDKTGPDDLLSRDDANQELPVRGAAGGRPS